MAGPSKPSAPPKRRKRQPHFAVGEVDPHAALFRVAPSDSMPKRVFVLCHYCGYSPPADVPKGGICPKCHGMSWERYAMPEPLVPRHMK